jgi:hypothetical protein
MKARREVGESIATLGASGFCGEAEGASVLEGLLCGGEAARLCSRLEWLQPAFQKRRLRKPSLVHVSMWHGSLGHISIPGRLDRAVLSIGAQLVDSGLKGSTIRLGSQFWSGVSRLTRLPLLAACTHFKTLTQKDTCKHKECGAY